MFCCINNGNVISFSLISEKLERIQVEQKLTMKGQSEGAITCIESSSYLPDVILVGNKDSMVEIFNWPSQSLICLIKLEAVPT